jgi:prolyl oligopeptidase
MQVIGGHLVLSYLRDAHGEMEVRTLNGVQVRQVKLPGIGSSGGMVGDPDRDEAYYYYSSFVEPPQIFKTSIKSGETSQWAKVEFPVDTSKMTVEQVRYASKDGTQIPMFIIRNKDAAKDGLNPTILYGYGGFNINMTPRFSTSIAAWLERGGIYAIANLRGGGEFGEEWHKAGMLLSKQNVFDDFIYAAKHLIAEGWTKPEKLAIRGGSNGGLLVGAAMTQAPELFGAVVCAVPLLDMVRYHLFGSGKTWIPEYGSADDEAQFRALYAYSPYHRVRKDVSYPALLMMSADSDDRVDPMHARKFTAQIQWATSNEKPVLLRIERHAGHGGADLVKQQVEQNADMYAFLAAQLGM